jgi:hypothetical protein
MVEGPYLGFNINLGKNRIIVKPEHLEEAVQAFHDLPVVIDTSGELLGGFIGAADSTNAFVDGKVQEILRSVVGLTELAHEDPQNALAVFRSCTCARLNYLQQVVPGTAAAMAPLDHAIQHEFLQAVFGFQITEIALLYLSPQNE